jgi:hypothetical protein
MLDILNLAFVLFGRLARIESSQIATFVRLWVDFARIDAIAVFDFANHDVCSSRKVCPRRRRSNVGAERALDVGSKSYSRRYELPTGA